MTAIIIALQFKFIISYTGFTIHRKKLLWTLIGIHVLMAAIIGGLGWPYSYGKPVRATLLEEVWEMHKFLNISGCNRD